MNASEFAGDVAKALAREGFGAARIEPRDGRWLAHLPYGRMAWFPADADGRALLAKERRVLRLLEARCAFVAPRILYESPEGWDVRAPVAGVVEPTALYHRIRSDEALARRLGADIGAALAQQHAIPAELTGWLPTDIGWPMPDDWLRSRLPAFADCALLARIEGALAAYRQLPTHDPVLVHSDLGLHNICLDAGEDRLAGIFDYGGAALADRHEDFRYLIFDFAAEAMLDAALAAYEPAAGVRLDRARIHLANAACAIGFLAWRDGHAPSERWCGRTLPEDLAWTQMALARAGW